MLLDLPISYYFKLEMHVVWKENFFDSWFLIRGIQHVENRIAQVTLQFLIRMFLLLLQLPYSLSKRLLCRRREANNM